MRNICCEEPHWLFPRVSRTVSRIVLRFVAVARTVCLWSSIEHFAQIIEANFLCRDECVATQSVTDFGHRFDVLITRFYSNAQSCAEFPFMETCCVSVVDTCACTRFSRISSSITQRNCRGWHGATNKRKRKLITWSQVDLKLAPRLYIAYKARLVDQWNEQ